jgi:hypothetical protein
VDAQTHPKVDNSTESSVLGPFFTEDAAESEWEKLSPLFLQSNTWIVVSLGESIASEGKGKYLYVTGRILDTSGKPVPNATINTWETDEFGFYDTQYVGRSKPDCRGRLKSDREGRYEFRAVVPVAYPIPDDVRAALLLLINF